MDSKSSSKAQNGIEINIAYLAKFIFARWWIILLAGFFGASSGFMLSELTTDPAYTSSISFVVSNRVLTNEDSYSSSDINASITMANTYKYILSSRTLCEKVAASCGIPNMTSEDVCKAIKMSSVTNTNILIMEITTAGSARSYNLAVSVIDNFDAVVEKAGFVNSSLSVCDLPNVPVKPDTNISGIRYAVVGGFSATVIALIMILLSNVLKDTVQSVDEIGVRLDLIVLGVVSRAFKKSKKRKGAGTYDSPILMNERAAGFAFIETYKALRTRIESLSSKHKHKVFVVTSTGEGEGKTTVATNLAIALAQNGRSVLLIDADLRKPAVCRILSLTNITENKGHGLPDAILDAGSYEKAIRYVEKHKIFLLAGTSTVSDPTELLSTPQMERVIKAVRSEFDFVIIDTAPAGVVTDASIITNYADALIMVIREDQSPVDKIRGALADLSNGRAEIIGCVYNNVNPVSNRRLYSQYTRRYRNNSYGYDYVYGYGYGYGNGYGNGYENGNDTGIESDSQNSSHDDDDENAE